MAVARGKAVLLGGFATGAALCACLSLVGFAYFCVGILTLDDDRSAPGWMSFAFGGVWLALSCGASSRFGWQVGRDWFRNRQNEPTRPPLTSAHKYTPHGVE
jgi:hypothetical protein